MLVHRYSCSVMADWLRTLRHVTLHHIQTDRGSPFVPHVYIECLHAHTSCTRYTTRLRLQKQKETSTLVAMREQEQSPTLPFLNPPSLK